MSDETLYLIAYLFIFLAVPLGAFGAYIGISIADRRRKIAHRDVIAGYRVPSHRPGVDWVIVAMHGIRVVLFLAFIAAVLYVLIAGTP